MVSTAKGSWAGHMGVGESEGADGAASGGGGTSRPATNITGASWTSNSGGYEFIVVHVVGKAN